MSDATKKNLRRAGVIGWPVSHSLSPLIHATWAAREGVPVSYEAIAAPASYDDFARVADQLKAQGYRGANVTIPHKEHALRYASAASQEARDAGAANMLTFRGDGAFAENSDIAGFAAALGDGHANARALIIGAGGAARGVAIALRRHCGAGEISIVNRTRARAGEIASIVSADVVDWDKRNAALAGADIVVNATALGMNGQPPLDLDWNKLKAGAVVVDIVYSPLETPLLAAARKRGLATIDGLEMLMRQAAPGYLAWLGTRAEIDADLRARLEAALTARAA